MQAQQNNNKQPVSYLKTLRDDPTVYKQSLQQLTQIAKKELKPTQIIETLQNFYSRTQSYRSYTKNRGPKHDYRVLLKKYGKELVDVYGLIANFVIERETKADSSKIQILWANEAKQVKLNKPDIVLILCLMSLMLLPVQIYQEDPHKQSNFNHLKNFTYIFTNVQFKTISIIQYLKIQIPLCPNHQQLTLKRTVLHEYSCGCQTVVKKIVEQFGGKQMGGIKVMEDDRDIQQFYGQIKVDFANKYIGGGALTFGAVQEQIMMAVHPQMYISMLICQKMNNNQALQFKGFKKYFQSQGYNANVQITGPKKHQYNNNIQAEQLITAIDAINFYRQHGLEQYSQECIIRQIVKAYAGFSQLNESNTVVSGNWGCGVFGGDVQLKILIQWIAASMAGKRLRYCPYGSRSKVHNQTLLSKGLKLQVGDFLQLLLKSAAIYNKQLNAKEYNLRAPKQQSAIYSLILQHLS